MEADIVYHSGQCALRVVLSPKEAMVVAAAALASHTLNARIEPRSLGGRVTPADAPGPGGLRLVQVTASDEPVEMLLCPSVPGDILRLRISAADLHVVSGSFLAASPQVRVTESGRGAHAIFAWESPALLTCANVGDVFLNAHGAFHILELQEGQGYRVHTSHIAAFDGTVGFTLAPPAQQRPESPLAEGKWCDFVGPGRVYMQTRSVDGLLGRLAPRLLGAP
ncbi:MAG: AIM24 family protein [Armatimonadota bacterium]